MKLSLSHTHPELAAEWHPTRNSDLRPDDVTAWGFCLSQLARRAGQRALDVDESRRKSVLTVLRVLKVPEDWVHGVEEVLERKGDEQSQLFGESLPIGLRLVPP